VEKLSDGRTPGLYQFTVQAIDKADEMLSEATIKIQFLENSGNATSALVNFGNGTLAAEATATTGSQEAEATATTGPQEAEATETTGPEDSIASF